MTAPVPVSDLLADAPYLAELASRHADWLADTPQRHADTAFAAILNDVAGAGLSAASEDEVGAVLREAKGKAALLCALAETGGTWSTAQATAALADFADAALDAGLAVLLRLACARGTFAVPDLAPNACGLVVFALGKHGGRELNYSSDIDIVAFFDGDRAVVADPSEATRVYSRIVQRLASLMQDRIGGRYVFRTDLRLRPDPGSTPVALSFNAALTYYEARGQNWERAAWIKARPATGDIAAGDAFLAELAPYVWRKHLDFATIADIQAMKRQINAAKSVGEARVEGHNVKLGRGGIREIEFFTQTQQLIAGGRDRSLRVRPTAEALSALAAAGWITTEAARELTSTYWFLRAVENRLQMLRDEQTQTMPEDAAGIDTIARTMGYPDRPTFETAYRAALATVSRHYASLFAEQETLGSGDGNLVFTGGDDDPGTLETLAAMGFADPAKVSATVRKWHYGSYPATRASAARAHLTELLPALLRTIAGTGSADGALARFDDFISRLPAGVPLFSLLRTHERLMVLLTDFMASAPRMSEAVIHRAHVMDGLIDPAFADDVNRTAVLVDKVRAFLGEARDYSETIDRARIIGQEQKFLIAAGLLSGTMDAARAARQFTALAETLLRELFVAVRREFEARHGRVPGAGSALLGFGKMGSGEMTYTSDLDVVLLYDVADPGAESDGERPLAVSQYFARLTQRMVAAVSAPTAEGVLYEVDMRLRPSGNAGPLATSLAAFRAYHAESAWTWERMALSRARVLFADEGLSEAIEAEIVATLGAPRPAAATIADVLDMRARLARERKPRHAFDLKLADGGLIDLEFIAQSAQLVAGATLAAPQAPTAAVLVRLGETGLLPVGQRLAEIHLIFSAVLQVMSAALTEPFREEGWTDAFRELLARRTNYPSFSQLSADLDAMRAEVRAAASDWYVRAAAL